MLPKQKMDWVIGGVLYLARKRSEDIKQDARRDVVCSPPCHVRFVFFLLHPAASSAIINTTSSTHHQHNTTPSTLHDQKQHHQHNIVNTTPSRQHHQHNTIINTPSTKNINTTPPTLHHQKQHHQHNISNTTPSRQHHQHNTINTSSSTQHHQHNTINTKVGWSPATIEYRGRRLRLRGRHSTWSTSVSFVWQVQQAEHLSFFLRGRCSMRSTSREVRCVCVAGAFCVAQSHLRGRRSTWSTSVSFWVIYTTPSTQHHLHYIVNTTPSTLHQQTQHHQQTSSTLHHQHSIINTTSSTHHHLHNTIYTTPSQHHPHNTIYTTSSHTARCSAWSTAILPLLPHSCWYPSCYSSFVVCSLFCFVDLFHTWMSENIVNMWGFPVL